MKIRNFKVWSVAKVFGFVYTLIGLFMGVVATLFMLFAPHDGPESQFLPILATLILPPLFNGALGFLMGALGTYLYNITTRYTGGIEMEVE